MSGDRELEDFFLKEKPVELLVQLSRSRTDNYASALSSEVDVTYSHTVKCLQEMNNKGLVKFKRQGRRKQVVLTDKGDDLAGDFYCLLKKLTDQ